jgi:glycosyltransferase involved in cell wall biosynthesis
MVCLVEDRKDSTMVSVMGGEKNLPVRVIHTIGSLGEKTGGPAQSVTGLSSALVEYGCLVEILTLDTGSHWGPPVIPTNPGVTTSFARCRAIIGSRTCWSSEFGRLLERRIRQNNISVIHDHGVWLPSNHEATHISKMLGVPIVKTPHGALSRWAFGYHRIRKRLAWLAFQRRDLETADILHATSDSEALALRDLGLKRPIAVVPNAIDLPEMPPSDRSTRETRICLFLSRIHPSKGLSDLVEAWRILRPSGWKVLVVGPDEGSHLSEIKHKVNKVGLRDSFEFRDSADRVTKWRYFADADLFVLPTSSENFGIAVAEALGAGIPVITTKHAPWHDLITNKCGWWTDSGPEPLAEALREALGLSHDDRAAMGERGRDLVKTQFSWKIVSRQMIEVYEWVLHGGPVPSRVRLS